MRPGPERYATEVRPWGGANLLVFTDWWQLPPVRQTAIFANPFKHNDHHVSRIMSMFWNKDMDSMNAVVELTEAKRCKDKWLLAFVQECRDGRQSWEMSNERFTLTWCFSISATTYF